MFYTHNWIADNGGFGTVLKEYLITAEKVL